MYILKLPEWLWGRLNRTISQLLKMRVIARALHEYRPFVINEQRQFVVLANTLSLTNLLPKWTRWTWPRLDVTNWATSWKPSPVERKGRHSFQLFLFNISVALSAGLSFKAKTVNYRTIITKANCCRVKLWGLFRLVFIGADKFNSPANWRN